MLRPFLVSTAALAIAGASIAQSVPTGFTIDTLVSSGLAAPHDFCFLPDGRVLVANRAGPVAIYAGGAAVTIGTVPNVQTSSEQGLLSIAADPNFNTNGYVYVWYASSLDAFMHLDRFTCTGTLNNPGSTALTLDTASRRVILGSTPDNAFNHNGGSLRFGPDDMLYVSIGDDASGCPAQQTNTWLGCVMRMDVSVVPAGASTTAPLLTTLDPGNNPLSANTDISQLIIAHGLRNPFRMEIDQLTGNLYIGDVGQNVVEEYDEYVYPSVGALPLRNYGWPWREANNSYITCTGTLPPGLVAPIASVVQTSANWFSVMGGPVYRNQNGQYDFGPGYEGCAYYLDYFAGEVRRLVNTGSWVAAPTVPGQPNATNWGTGFVGTTAFRQGPDGAIWFTQHPSTYATSGGSLKRVRPLGPVNSVAAVSGTGQIANSGEVFAQPVVVRVFDPSNNPLPGGTVNFSVSGAGTLSTTNPVIADANGFAQTIVTSSPSVGGAVNVSATTPGGLAPAAAALFTRRLTVTPVGGLMVLQLANSTQAVPANVPYILMMSFPHTPILPTFFGPLVTNPFVPTTIVLEDGFNIFPRPAWAGSGGTGTPSLSKVYTPPAGLLTGYTMAFQAVGVDPITGWFKTNAEWKQF